MAISAEEQQYLDTYGSGTAIGGNSNNLNQIGNNPTTINNLNKEEQDFLKFTKFGQEESSVDYIRPSSGEEFDFSVYKHDDPVEIRALNQSAGEKWVNGIGRGITTAVTSAAENSIGLAAGIGQLTVDAFDDQEGEGISGLSNNPFGRMVDSINDYVRESLPIYYSKEEQKMNVLQSMGTANFWADKFLNGAGYMAGAWMSGWGAGAALNKLEQASLKSLAKEAVEEASKKALSSGIISRSALQNAAVGTLMAHGESSVEARGIRQGVIDRLSSEREQGLNTLSDEEITTQANAAANVGYVLNMALVGGTDFFQFGKALTGNKVAKQVKAELTDELVEEGGKQITKTVGKQASFYDKYLKGFTQGVALEGGQEMGQLAIEKGATEYYSSKYDPESNLNFLGSLKDITEAGIKNLGTNEGWESFILGAILGGGTGVVTNYGEATEQENRNKRAAEFYNSGEYKNLLNSKDNLIRIGYYGKKEEEAALSGNVEYLQDAKSNSLNAYVQFMEENGSTDFTIKKLEDLKGTPAQDLKSFFGIPESADFTEEAKNKKIDEQISKIKEARKDYQTIRENYPGISKPVFDLLFDAARNLKNTTQRINSLASEVNQIMTDFNSDTLFDEKEYKSNEEYRKSFDERSEKLYNYLNTVDPLAAKAFDDKLRGLKYLSLERREKYQKQWEEVNADPDKFNYIAEKDKELNEQIVQESVSQANYLEAVQNKHFAENTSDDNVTGFNSAEFEAEMKNKEDGYLEVEYGDTRDASKRKKIKVLRREGEPVTSKNGQTYQKYVILDEEGKEKITEPLLNPTETQVEPSETVETKRLKYTKQRDAQGHRLLVDENGVLHRYFDVRDSLTPVKSKEEVRNDLIYEIRIKALEQIAEETKQQIDAVNELIQAESEQLSKDLKSLFEKLVKQRDKVYKTLAGPKKLKNSIRRLRYKIDKSNEKIDVLVKSKQKLEESLSAFTEDIQSIGSESIAAGVEEIVSLYNSAIENNNKLISDIVNEIDSAQKVSINLIQLLALKNISLNLNSPIEELSEKETELVFSNQRIIALENELENYINLNQELKNSVDRLYNFEKVYRKLMDENIVLRNSIIYSNVPLTEETKKPLNNAVEIEPSVKEEYDSGFKKSIQNMASTTGVHFEDEDNTKLTSDPNQLRWFRALPKLVIDNTKDIFKLKIVTPKSENGKYANFFLKNLLNDPNAAIGILYINNKPYSYNEETDEFEILEEKDLNINNALFTGIAEASLKNKYGSKFYDEEDYTAEEIAQILEIYSTNRQNLINLANTQKEVFVAVNAKSSGVVKNKNNRRANDVERDETTPVENSSLIEYVDGDLNKLEIIIPTISNTTVPGIIDRKLTPGIAYVKTPSGQIVRLKNNQISESLATKILEAIMFTNSENNDTTKEVKAKTEKKAKSKKIFLKKEDLSKIKDGLFEGQKVYYKKNRKYKKSRSYPYIYKKVETPSSIKQLQLKQVIDWYQSIVYFGPKTKGTNGKEFYFEKGNLYYFNIKTNKVESLDLKKGLTEAEKESVIDFIKTKYHQVNKAMLAKNDEFEAFDGLIFDSTGKPQPLVVKYDSYKDYLLSNENTDGSERKTSDIPLTVDFEEKGEDTFMSSYVTFNSSSTISKEAELATSALTLAGMFVKEEKEEKEETKFTGETEEGPGNLSFGATMKAEALSNLKNFKDKLSTKIRNSNPDLLNLEDIQKFLKTQEGKDLYNQLKEEEGTIIDLDEKGFQIKEPVQPSTDPLEELLNKKNAGKATVSTTDKKADIERRRQEELKQVPTEEQFVAYMNQKYPKANFRYWDEAIVLAESSSNSNRIEDSQKGYLAKNREIKIKQINAKYDEEYVDRVKKGEFTAQQAKDALKEIDRLTPELSKQIDDAELAVLEKPTQPAASTSTTTPTTPVSDAAKKAEIQQLEKEKSDLLAQTKKLEQEVVNLGGKSFNGVEIITDKSSLYQINNNNEVEIPNTKRALSAINSSLSTFYNWDEFPDNANSTLTVVKKPKVSLDKKGNILVAEKGKIIFDAERKAFNIDTSEIDTKISKAKQELAAIKAKYAEQQTAPVSKPVTTTKQIDINEEEAPFKLARKNVNELINIEKAKEWLNKKFPNLPVHVVDSLIHNKAWGMATANTVYLSTLAEKGTEYHEGFHLAKLFTLTVNQKQLLDKEASEIYPEYTEEDLEALKLNHPSFTREELIETYYEELMADDFMDYKLTGKMPERIQKYIDGKKENKSFIQKFFDIIKDFIKFFSNTEDSNTFIESFFKEVANENKSINIYNKYTVDNRYKQSRGLLKEADPNEILLGENIYNKIANYFTYSINLIQDKEGFKSSEILANNYKDYNVTNIYDKLFAALKSKLNNRLKELNSISNRTEFDEKIIKQLNFLLQEIENPSFKSKIVDRHNTSLKKYGISLDLEVNDENEVVSKNDFADYNDSKNVKKSFTEYLDPILKVYLSSVPSFNKNLKQEFDEYGLPVIKSFESVASKLGRYLTGSLNSNDILNKLEKLSNIEPGYRNLYDELLKLNNSLEIRDILLLNKFTQSFAKGEIGYNMSLIQKEGVVRILNTSEEISADARIKSWKSNIKELFNESGSIVKGNRNNPEFSLSILKKVLVDNKTINTREILNLFGITFSEDLNVDDIQEAKDLAGQLKEFFTKQISNNKKEITVEDIYNKLFNSRIKKLAEILVNKEGLVENNHRGPDGETRYDLVQYNYLLRLVTAYDNLKNDKNAYDSFKEEYPFLFNIYTENSELLKKGGYLFDDSGYKTNNPISIEIVEGSKLDDSGEIGDTYNNIKTPDRITTLINNILNNKLPFLQSSDKSLQYNLSIDLGYTEKDENANNVFKDFYNDLSVRQKYTKHFENAFRDEFNRVRESRIQESIKDSNYPGKFIKHYNSKSLKFSLFEGMFSSENGKSFLDSITSSADFLNADIDSNTLFNELFKKRTILNNFQVLVEEYIDSKNQESINYLVENGLLFEDEGGIKQLFITTELLPTSVKEKDEQKLYNTIKAINVISTLGYIEQLKMFTGDPAFYKNLNDIFKRVPMFTGMKKNMNVSQALNEKLTKVLKRSDNKVSDGTINTLVYSDVAVTLKDYNKLFSRFKKQFPKLSDNDINSLLKPYNEENITEPDGQGYVSVDELMELMLRSGEYDVEYYKILKKIQSNQIINEEELKKVYQPYKLVYGGPGLLSNQHSEKGTLNSPTYFKFSVLPLIPSLIKGTNLELLANDMKTNKIGISLFESANKVGGLLGKNGKFKPFYDKSGKFNRVDVKKDNINTIDYRFLGIQVDIADYSKEDGIMGSQVVKLISSNLASNSVYQNISIPVYDSNGIVKEYKSVNSKELQEEYDELTYKTLVDAWENLLNELDAVNVGNNTFKFNNLDGLKYKLEDQALKRGSSQNVINAIRSLTKEDSVVSVGIDMFPNRTKLEQILYALVKNNVIRRRSLGAPKIQAAITGFEKQDVARSFDENSVMLTSDSLNFYREGKFGETLPIQVSIALPESMIEYVIKNYGDGKISSLPTALDKFNEKLENFFSKDSNRYSKEALKELGIDLKILQYIGYRIPTQGLNSIESMEIRKFLHPSSGDTIVVPSGIVAKAGSDFDIDKLNIFSPYFISYKDKLIYMDNEDSINAEYENLKKNLDKKELKILNKAFDSFKNENPFEKNRLYEISKQILLSPENYTQLLTPNSSAKIKSMADEINDLYGKKEESNLSNLVNWVYNSKVASNNFVGKMNVGITALHLTTHRLFQQVGVKIKPDEVNKLNFKDMENLWSISGKMDMENKYEISEILTQFLNAYVDIAKEPFVLDLNATTEVAGIIFYLLRRGVPVENVVYFINQPIIREYIKSREAEESYVKVASELKDDRKSDTVFKLKRKYGSFKEDVKIEPYSKENLKSTIKPFENLSKEEKQIQSYYLDEFQRYQEHSKELSDLMRAINQDTKFGKTKAEFITKNEVDVEKAKNLNLFEEGTLEKLQQKTLLKGFVYVHKNTPLLYQELTTLTENETFKLIRNKIIDLIYVADINTENRNKLVNLLEQDWITYLLETSKLTNVKGSPYTVSQYYKTMFDKLPSILNKLQRNYNITDESFIMKNNPLIQALVPILYNPKSKVNNIQLFNRKMPSITEDILVDAYKELKSMVDSGVINNADYKTLINFLPLFSIAQSGLSTSPISFTDKLPVNIFTKLSVQMFNDFVNKLGDNHETFLDEFFRNNFNNNSLVPKLSEYKQGEEGRYYSIIDKDGTITINNLSPKSNYPYLKVFIKDPKWEKETYDKKSGEPLGEYKLFRVNSKNDTNTTYIEVPKQGDAMFFKEYYKILNSSLLENNSNYSENSKEPLNSKFWKQLNSKKEIKLPTTQPTETKEADKKEDKDCTTTPTN